MSNVIVRKDLLLLRRDKLLISLLAAIVMLIVISLLAGVQRERVFDKEKAAALEVDRSVWMGQGARNPHSAAHFSRYAFRPASPLAMLDPGTTDFAGLAIWMEAHFQDPAVFRRAEDGGELSRYAQLSPAFLLLAVAPLAVFMMLFGSVSGEREAGTLRQLLATGVSAGQFFRGKLVAGLRATLTAYVGVFIPIAAISAIASPAEFDSDAFLRLASLFFVYAIYLIVFVAIALGVSALTRTRQAAFLALTVVWTLMVTVLPGAAGDIATSVHPQPDPRDAAERLSAASNTYYGDMDRREQIEKDVLDRFGVSTVDDLPIDYGAYVLQTSEELSEPEFDAFYADLESRYSNQERLLRTFGLLTPTIAATSLSKGIAGTDRVHQREFAVAAEGHRREMIKLLNEDYMYNAGEAGYGYSADADLWARFEDLDYALPRLSKVGHAYWLDSILLLLWTLLALSFASWAVRRAATEEEGLA